MSNNNIPDTCLVRGPYGTLVIQPSEFIIPTGFVESAPISISFIANQFYYQGPVDIVATIEIKDNSENLIEMVEPIVEPNLASRLLFQELQPGKFQITLKTNEFSPSFQTIFTFKIKVPETRSEMQCCTVNVDAIASGFGLVYNYFKIESNQGTGTTAPPNTGSLTQDPLPEKFSAEKILVANSYYLYYDENYENITLLQQPDSRRGNLLNEVINENMLPNINILGFLQAIKKQKNKRFLNQQLNEQYSLDLINNSTGSDVLKSFYDPTVEGVHNNKFLINLSTLGGLINGKASDSLSVSPTNSSTTFYAKNYFDELAEDIKTISSDPEEKIALSLSPYQNFKSFLFNSRYENVLFPAINNMKNMFPMFSHVFIDRELAKNAKNFATETTTSDDPLIENIRDKINIQKSNFLIDSITKNSFNKILKEKNLLDYFYYCLVYEISKENFVELFGGEFPNTSEFVGRYFGGGGVGEQNYNNIVNDNQPIFYIGDFDFVNLGSTNISQLNSLLNDYQFRSSLEGQILCYRIDKWRTDDPQLLSLINEDDTEEAIVDRNSPKPLHSYYIINNFETGFFQFLDSQVKYEKEYEYRIYKYYIKKDNISRLTVGKQFVESIKTKIVDDPPVSPSIQIVPFKGVDTEFLILFSPNSGRYYSKPIAINQNDNQQINLILSSSFRKNEGLIQFEGDDLIDKYELMRLETEPKNYSDFSNSFIRNIIASENGSASLIERIEPNKKYYYIVRSRDVHNKFSNPISPIEIELINESGMIYLKKRYIDFEEIKFEPSKQFDKFIKIKPNLSQIQSSNTQLSAFDVNYLNVGPDNKVWGKNYVLRMTSRVTGKKIDIKFKFAYNLKK